MFFKIIFCIIFSCLALGCLQKSDELNMSDKWPENIANHQDDRELSTLLKAYITALEDNSRKDLCLNKGASPNEITHVEEVTGVKFTEDMKLLYIEHNGQNFDGSCVPLFIGGYHYFSLSELITEWKNMKTLTITDSNFGKFIGQQGAVLAYQWNSKWLPIAGKSTGDFICFDSAPSSRGNIGQIIEYSIEDSLVPHLAMGIKEYFSIYSQKVIDNQVFFDATENSFYLE